MLQAGPWKMANTVKCLKVVPLAQVSVVSLEVTCVFPSWTFTGRHTAYVTWQRTHTNIQDSLTVNTQRSELWFSV